mmetsp:Transcript_43430/g.64413  ORF Transcript_43430/g.64413 Transcript_43430/m.64413 type:complete len:207 (-) Transcript_43430:114-734(-)
MDRSILGSELSVLVGVVLRQECCNTSLSNRRRLLKELSTTILEQTLGTLAPTVRFSPFQIGSHKFRRVILKELFVCVTHKEVRNDYTFDDLLQDLWFFKDLLVHLLLHERTQEADADCRQSVVFLQGGDGLQPLPNKLSEPWDTRNKWFLVLVAIQKENLNHRSLQLVNQRWFVLLGRILHYWVGVLDAAGEDSQGVIHVIFIVLR